MKTITSAVIALALAGASFAAQAPAGTTAPATKGNATSATAPVVTRKVAKKHHKKADKSMPAAVTAAPATK